MQDYGYDIWGLLVTILVVVPTIELAFRGRRLAAAMRGGLQRVCQALFIEIVLRLTPFFFVLFVDFYIEPTLPVHFVLALLAGLMLQLTGNYTGPFRPLLSDLAEGRDRVAHNRVHGLPLDEPNRQTEKVS